VRAKAASVSARTAQVKAVLRGLPSGYNRDLQETKAAFMDGIGIGLASVRVMGLLMRKLAVHEDRLIAGHRPEIYAADRALELAAGGTPFRDAYREVARDLEGLKAADPREAIRRKRHTGAPGNLRLDVPEAQLEGLRKWAAARRQAVREKLTALAGFEVVLYRSPRQPEGK
jgi:argininosuccinate lyase